MELGKYLRDGLNQKLSHFRMVWDIRAVGMLSGIEFEAPKSIAVGALKASEQFMPECSGR